MTSADGTVNYTYDGRGNQILEQNTAAGTSTEMEYAVTGEMTELTEYSGETATMTQNNLYDHNGIRIMKTEGGASRYYYYDSGACAFTMDGDDVSIASILTPQGSVAGSYRDSTYHTYLKDQQGSTTSIVKDDGTLSAAYDYSDFGETAEITESGFDNQICYTGSIYDDETGLYYLNARYYDPELGRFISQDTYRGMPEESDQWHLYAYCANNPINYVDPSGHWTASVSKSWNKYTVKCNITWREINKIIAGTAAVSIFISAALSRISVNPIAAAACSTFLVIGVLSSITSMIIDKYLINHSIRMTLSFNYATKYKKVIVKRKSKKITTKVKYYKITNRKWSVNVLG